MIIFVLFFIFLTVLLGVPIAISFGFGSFFYCLLVNVNPIIIPQRMFASLDSFTFLAIPFFLLVGNLMNISGVTTRILNFARSLVGQFVGGLGHTNVLASMLFAGLSGSAIADAAGLGTVEMKMMRESGYPDNFSASITLASSVIGPIIPPSIIMVIYGMVATVSIGRMLLAGLLPGIFIGLSLMVMVHLKSYKKNYPRDKWAGWQNVFKAFREALLPLLTPVIILGGIVGGIFTPTEVGAVAAVYTLFLGVFVFKEIKWKNLIEAFLVTTKMTGLIGFIIAVSGIFSWMITIEGVPRDIVNMITSLTSNMFVVLLLIDIAILILGCFIDAGPLVILIVPVLLPLLNTLNVNLVHFGVVVCFGATIGLITPPVGACLYVTANIFDLDIDKLVKGVLPFLSILIIALLAITFIPKISLFLPELIFGY